MKLFQSTLPLRGVTAVLPLAGGLVGISIHTPLAGSDLRRRYWMLSLHLFQSTLPLRGVTFDVHGFAFLVGISIHTPLAGSDAVHEAGAAVLMISIHTPLAGSDPGILEIPTIQTLHFNPHSPCGE